MVWLTWTRYSRRTSRASVRAGAVNPNVFQAQEYKYGSFGNPDPDIRAPGDRALRRERAHRRRAGQSRSVTVVCRRIELSGHRQHSRP